VKGDHAEDRRLGRPAGRDPGGHLAGDRARRHRPRHDQGHRPRGRLLARHPGALFRRQGRHPRLGAAALPPPAVVARMEARAAGLCGLAALRVIMLEALPLDEERDLEAQIEISFWGRALGSRRCSPAAAHGVRPLHRAAARATSSRRRKDGLAPLRAWTLRAGRASAARPDRRAQRRAGVLYPDRVTPDRQQEMLDDLLGRLRP